MTESFQCMFSDSNMAKEISICAAKHNSIIHHKPILQSRNHA